MKTINSIAMTAIFLVSMSFLFFLISCDSQPILMNKKLYLEYMK
jgi:hypothetical protein